MEDIGMIGYVGSQLDICRSIGAETARLSFEKGEWAVTITVKRKN